MFNNLNVYSGNGEIIGEVTSTFLIKASHQEGKKMETKPFTPENTTILMVDYSAGFVNSFRSHNVNEHITATVALAKTALGFRSGLVVNLGAGQIPYPQLVQARALSFYRYSACLGRYFRSAVFSVDRSNYPL